MPETALTGAWLLARMGPGWSERPAGCGEMNLFRWWTACLLRAGDRREERVAAACAALAKAGSLSPGRLAASSGAVAGMLAEAGLRSPEALAARLGRAAAALAEQHEGSLERLAAGSPSLEELGGRLVALGPGFGPGSALRFLRPLRDHWAAADEAPLDPAARAAAAHLGWLDASDELEGASALLRRRLADEPDAPPLPSVEDALERLGRAACRRDDTRRCPLGETCPARA